MQHQLFLQMRSFFNQAPDECGPSFLISMFLRCRTLTNLIMFNEQILFLDEVLSTYTTFSHFWMDFDKCWSNKCRHYQDLIQYWQYWECPSPHLDLKSLRRIEQHGYCHFPKYRWHTPFVTVEQNRRRERKLKPHIWMCENSRWNKSSA